MDMVEVLSFLLMLSTMELGQVCLVSLRATQAIEHDLDITQEFSTENLSPTQSAMLADLSNYGLIWQHSVRGSKFLPCFYVLIPSSRYPQPNARRFSPSRLATTLTSSSPPLPTSRSTGGGSDDQGFIVLETNYRLYAYTGAYRGRRNMNAAG